MKISSSLLLIALFVLWEVTRTIFADPNLTATNTPPTIEPLPDYFFGVFAIGDVGSIPIRVHDAESPSSALHLYATSSNQIVLPDSNLVFCGRTNILLLVKPLQYGDVRITVMATDPGGASSTASFYLTIHSWPGSSSPTISSTVDQSVTLGQPIAPVPFNVAIRQVQWSWFDFRSSNTNLIANEGLTVFRADDVPFLLLSPKTGQIGSTTILWQGFPWFTITINPGGGPLTIHAQPQDQWAFRGGSALFHVGCSGTGPFRFQWFHEGTAISEATNAVLTLPSVSTESKGNYWVRVASPLEEVISNSATLRIRSLSLLSDAHGQSLRILGNVGEVYQLSTTCDPRLWLKVAILTNQTGAVDYAEPEALPARFFRVKRFLDLH